VNSDTPTVRTAVVTGAGSGVGRATAVALAQNGWRVGLVGRRIEALEETARAAGAAQCLVLPCDVGDEAAVRSMAAAVFAQWGPVDALVNAAGLNTPRRALEVLSTENYRALMGANLDGAYFCTQAFLPGMRERGVGDIVNIISDAGKQASPKAGPAYVMSKFGLAGLTQSINAEERARGIRACGIFPGDIDTPILNLRPVVPDAAARAKMMQPEDIAEAVLFCLKLPRRVVVEELLLRPR
jgi:NAD(P)-dependent dehydrogenase (short-subunit alcohol dehydrogenase family)